MLRELKRTAFDFPYLYYLLISLFFGTTLTMNGNKEKNYYVIKIITEEYQSRY